MSRVLVGSTIPVFAMANDDSWSWWLANAQQITETAADAGHEVSWLAVLQHDARGLDTFGPLIHGLAGLARSRFIAFSLDLRVPRWDSGTRLAGIVTGRNLIIDHALRTQAEWVYFADADIEAPDDVLVRLLELDWPVVGAHVPTYCLDGEKVRSARTSCGAPWWPPLDADVRQHWNTAGSLLVRRDVFRRVPWRIDPDAGDTDDPATQHEMEKLGYPTLVRHDVICRHHPESIAGFENRGLDRTVYR